MKYKSISHVERLHNRDLTVKSRPIKSKLQQVFAIETKSKNGKLFKEEKITTIDPKEELGKYKVTDFCLENLIELGAVANLKNVNFGSDKFSIIDSATSMLDKLDNIKIENNK